MATSSVFLWTVEVVVARKSNKIRNFLCTVLQCQVVLRVATSSVFLWTVEVVVAKKSNKIRNFLCTVLQCQVVLNSLKASLFSTAMSTLKRITIAKRAILKVMKTPLLLMAKRGRTRTEKGVEGCCCLLVSCLTSLQTTSVSHGRICSDKFTCCHIEIEAVDQTFYLP